MLKDAFQSNFVSMLLVSYKISSGWLGVAANHVRIFLHS